MATATNSSSSPLAASGRQGNVDYLRLAHNFISQGAHSRLTIVVIGEAGQGKSTLINSLAGKQVAKEVDGFEAEKTGLDCIKLSNNDIHVEFWESQGLGTADPMEEEKTLQKMARDIKDVDLVLYCIRMDSRRWPKRSDTETIVKITEVFTKKIWSHCLFVLTFANCAVEQLRLEDENDDLKAQFSTYCSMWENRIREQLRNLASLNNKEVEHMPVVPVGSSKGDNPWILPDGKDWHDSFWLESTNRMRREALPALLQLNRHRFTSELPPKIKPGDVDQESVDPKAGEVRSMQSPRTQTTNNGHQTSINSGRPQTKITIQTSGVDQNIDEPWKKPLPLNEILSKHLEKKKRGYFFYIIMGVILGGALGAILGGVAGAVALAMFGAVVALKIFSPS